MNSVQAVTCGLITSLAALASQQTIVVDAAGGADFMEIQPAVNAASPGDVVRVRHGGYSAVTVAKGIRLLGDPLDPDSEEKVIIGGTLQFLGLPAGETIVAASLHATNISVVACHGDVYLGHLSGALLIANSDNVNLDQVSAIGAFSHAANILDSRVVDVRGSYLTALGPAINIERSLLSLVDTSVAASIFSIGSGEPATIVTDSQVQFSPGTSVYSGGNPPGPAYELRGTNRAWQGLHTVLVDRSEDGTSVVVSLQTEKEAPFVMLGFSNATRPLRLPIGDFYLDFESLQLLHAGISPTGSPRSKTFMLPPEFDRQNGWVGIPVTFQAAVVDQAGQLSLSLPYTLVF